MVMVSMGRMAKMVRLARMLLMVMLMVMVRLVRMLMVRMLLMLMVMVMVRLVRKADDVGWCNGTPRYCFPNFYWQPSDIHKMAKMVLVEDIHKTFS